MSKQDLQEIVEEEDKLKGPGIINYADVNKSLISKAKVRYSK